MLTSIAEENQRGRHWLTMMEKERGKEMTSGN